METRVTADPLPTIRKGRRMLEPRECAQSSKRTCQARTGLEVPSGCRQIGTSRYGWIQIPRRIFRTTLLITSRNRPPIPCLLIFRTTLQQETIPAQPRSDIGSEACLLQSLRVPLQQPQKPRRRSLRAALRVLRARPTPAVMAKKGAALSAWTQTRRMSSFRAATSAFAGLAPRP